MQLCKNDQQNAILRSQLDAILVRVAAIQHQQLKNTSISISPVGVPLPPDSSSSSSSSSTKQVAGGYSKAELEILKFSSFVYARCYNPWLADEEQHESFRCPAGQPFCDPDGLLVLSKKQMDHQAGVCCAADVVLIVRVTICVCCAVCVVCNLDHVGSLCV